MNNEEKEIRELLKQAGKNIREINQIMMDIRLDILDREVKKLLEDSRAFRNLIKLNK